MKTKLSLLWFTLVFTVYFNLSFGQGVAIGDKEFTPNNAAILDVQSQNKGVLVPRMTYVQRMYIQTNAQSTGLLVYQTDRDAGFYYWDGVKWEYLAPPQTVELPNFATVATTGNYNDLLNKPTIPVALSDLTQSDQYHTVSNTEKEYWNSAAAGANFSGDYNDLTNKPTIPTRLQDLEQDPNYYTTVSREEREKWNAAAEADLFSGNYNDLSNKPDFKPVATTGDYTDLANKPTIPTRLQDLEQDPNYYTTVSREEREKWNAAAESAVFSGDYNNLTNKPDLKTVATTGDYTDLANKPTIPTRLQDLEQDPNYYTTVSRAERDRWDAAAEANLFSGNYNDLKNKPDLKPIATTGDYNDLINKPSFNVTIGEDGETISLATVALTGSYNDLTDRPTIGSDGSIFATVATTGNYNDLNNKPDLKTVATTGDYTDLANKPTIPTRLQDLEQDLNYYTTVSREEREKWNAAAESAVFSGDYNNLTNKPDLKTVATTGDYTDLANKPTIPTRLQDLEQDPNYYTTVSREEREKWNAAAENLKTVATTGDYNDLTNKPTIPTRLQDLEQDELYYTTITKAERDKWNATAQINSFSGDYNDLTNKPDIPVALSELSQNEYYRTVTDAEKATWNNKSTFSGYYSDLQDKPTIPTMLRDLQDDYNHLTVTELEKMSWNNKSTFSGKYTDLEDRPSIPTYLNQLQQDGYSRTVSDEEKAVWNGKSNFSGSYLDLSDRPNISTAASSGDYNDLTNKPFIPSKLSELDDDSNHRIVTDTEKATWNSKSSFSGSYLDLSDRPNISTAAGSGDYNDLTNKPFIPSKLSELDDDSNHRIVTDTEKTIWNSKSSFSGNYNDLTNKPFIPISLSELDGDANNRVVTDAEKTAWNNKSTFSGNYDDLTNLPELLTPADVTTLINDAILAAFPSGCVIMWYGDPNDVPTGWEIFYQMGGRFPVGAHHISTDEGLTKYSFGDKGGEEKHTLTTDEIPSHSHSSGSDVRQNITPSGSVSGQQQNFYGSGNDTYATSVANWTSVSGGGGQSHENRPPYLAIYFIKKK
jgi:hypothetical protein